MINEILDLFILLILAEILVDESDIVVVYSYRGELDLGFFRVLL